MRDTGRILATTIIWVALLLLLGWLLTTPVGAIANANSATILGVVIVLGVMAAMITGLVWQGGIVPQRRDADERALSSKRKRLRGDRVARLLDELSDDEVYELEALLLHEARAERDSAARRGER